MAFGKEIKRIREASGITASAMVELIGIESLVRYKAWEQKDNNPKFEDRKLIETFFGMELEEVMKLKKIPDNLIIGDKKITNESLQTETSYIQKRREQKNSIVNKGTIIFTDADFSAGNSIEFFDDSTMINSAYTMDIPEFAGTVSFRAYGDSMEPIIKSGNIVFATKIEDWASHLEYGQIYGIVCHDNRRYLKYIRKCKKESTHFLLKSENEFYDDFEIPKEKIKNVWLIHGWLNKRT